MVNGNTFGPNVLNVFDIFGHSKLERAYLLSCNMHLFTNYVSGSIKICGQEINMSLVSVFFAKPLMKIQCQRWAISRPISCWLVPLMDINLLPGLQGILWQGPFFVGNLHPCFSSFVYIFIFFLLFRTLNASDIVVNYGNRDGNNARSCRINEYFSLYMFINYNYCSLKINIILIILAK